MPSEKKIQINKNNCIQSVYFVLKYITSEHISFFHFKALYKLLSSSLARLSKLASYRGFPYLLLLEQIPSVIHLK